MLPAAHRRVGVNVVIPREVRTDPPPKSGRDANCASWDEVGEDNPGVLERARKF